MELCKNCHKREVDTSRSVSYCTHCLELRHKANKKYRESHKQDEYLCPSCNSKKSTRIIDFRPLGSFILEWT